MSPETRLAEASRAVAPVLVVDGIVKRFETPDGVMTAVDHISFDVSTAMRAASRSRAKQ